MQDALELVNKVEEDELENNFDDFKIVFKASEDLGHQ